MSGFRRYGRKPLKHTIKITDDIVGDVLVETQNVSESGVFISSASLPRALAVGDMLSAEIETDYSSGYSLDKPLQEVAQLKVVRVASDGVGFVFE